MSVMRVVRRPAVLSPDQTRVLLRPFEPGDGRRMTSIANRVAAMGDEEIEQVLAGVTAEFSARHEQIPRRFLERFEQLRGLIGMRSELGESRRMLIGSYFLAEYSLESAALFNPSMTPHPDQRGVPEGCLRFVLSLRATGEGHISSITFRCGLIGRDSEIELAASAGYLTEPEQVLNHSSRRDSPDYVVEFSQDLELSQRILFPGTPAQRNGIEDARFVAFVDDDGSCTYYATFTAYDGKNIRSELLNTKDFYQFRFFSLHGEAVRNKGLALFPRKIDGRYAMLARQDQESIHLMYSDHVQSWSSSRLLLQPKFSWEMVQVGNCGSPIETTSGWLVLSHGVGPMRQYSIGAFLLDLKDPSIVIGRLKEPLLRPSEREREGYVPNVVYSCGGLVHDGNLIVPYGIADHSTGFATVPLADVLAGMEKPQ